MVIFNSYVKLPEGKPKEPLHLVLKGPPPETRRWRPTSRAPVDFFVCKVRWALPKGGRALSSGTPKDKTIYFQKLWFMVDITIVDVVYKPTYNWGAPHCTLF